jgi:hypothetical protein
VKRTAIILALAGIAVAAEGASTSTSTRGNEAPIHGPASTWTSTPPQPVLLPQAELLRRLDPTTEWLFLPVAEWRQLIAAADRAAPKPRAGSGLVSGSIAIACTPAGCTATAELLAAVDAGTAASVACFADMPERIDSLRVAGAPGLLVAGQSVLLPGAGRWPLTLRWSQAAPAQADAGWSVSLPLPLAAALDITVTAPADWELSGPGLVADGPGRWRLSNGARRLECEVRPAGSQVRAWGVNQGLRVELPAAGAGGTFVWSLDEVGESIPELLRLRLPSGFVATEGGEMQPDGSVIVRPALQNSVTGIIAAGAGIDLPRLDGARWQGGVVSVDIAAPTLLDAPTGWLPVLRNDLEHPGARHFAVTAPGKLLVPAALDGASGIDLRSSAAVAVGGGSVRATWALELRSPAPLHRIEAAIPAGWRVLAAEAGGLALDLPPEDEVQTQPWPMAITLPKALAPGAVATLLLTLERSQSAAVPLAAPMVAGAVRSSTRLLIAADPATEVTVSPPTSSWSLGPTAAGGAGLEPVAELLATDDAPVLHLAVRPRPVRLEAEAVCWLLPRAEDCQVRLDLRLGAAGGALDSVRLALPVALGEGWTVEAGGAVLRDGTLTWPAAWSGERLLRLSARLGLTEGRTAAVRPRLDRSGSVVPLRLSVAVLAGERVDVTAATSGRVLEPDELPRWSAPPPGTRILAAWRPAGDEVGGATARAPQLHDPPAGFLDRVELRTQLAPGGGLTLLSARLAAPGLSALPITLPDGMTLEAALVDGEPAPVRRDSTGGCSVILPGRTQVQLALRLAHAAAPGELNLSVPGIALPWLASSWTVAVAPAWRAEVREGAGAMPLTSENRPPRRHLFGSWRPVQFAGEEEIPPVRLQAPPPTADPRLLVGAEVVPPTKAGSDAPVLALHGPRLHGQRIGAPAGLSLHLTSLDRLRAADQFGRVLGVIAGLGLIALAMLRRISGWRCLAVAAAAGSGAAGLLLAQVPVGPLLGACEAVLVLALLAATLTLRIRRSEVQS